MNSRLVFLLAATVAACGATEPDEVQRFVAESAVYTRVAESVILGGQPLMVVVLDTAPGFEALAAVEGEVRGSMPELKSETLADYRAAQALPREIRAIDLPIRGFLLTVSGEELRDLRGNNLSDFWNAFYRRYPGSIGYLALSRVGFDAKLEQALVGYTFYCGSLCGGGGVVLLTQVGASWAVSRHLELWIF